MKKRSSTTAITFIAVSLSLILIAFLAYFISNYVSPEKSTVTFQSADATKPYDGLPLEDHTWEIAWGTLKNSHTAQVRVWGSQTEIGSSLNFFEVSIRDIFGNDVTHKYNILLEPGILTVIDPLLDAPSDDTNETPSDDPAAGGENGTENGGVTGGGGTDGTGTGENGEGSGENGDGTGENGNGGGGGGGGGNGEMEMDWMLKVLTQRSGIFYLRHKSYGNYTGSDWDGLIYSYSNFDNPLLFLSYAMANAGYSLEEMQVITKTGQYYSPYHFSNKELCDNDDRTLPYGGKEYTINYYYDYDVSTLKDLSLAGTGFEQSELAYRKYVHDNYLTLSTNEATVLLQLASEAGISKDDPDVIEKVATYIQNAAKYNSKYKAYPADVNHVTYFLLSAREGVCEQFASAATLMYRALGIPARYVTGYAATVLADEWTIIPTGYGHAWVEVYIDGLGWIPVEVTGSDEGETETGGNGSADLDESGDLNNSDNSDNSGNGNTPVLVLKSNHTGTIYLRFTSFGNFTGQGFDSAVPYTALLDGTYSYNYLTSFALQNSGAKVYNIEIKNLTSQYLLPYFLGTDAGNYVVQTSDVRYEGDGQGEYSLSYYVYDGTGDNLIPLSSQSTLEQAYRQFVYDHYLTIEEPTLTAMQKIIIEQGFDRSDPDLISRVAAFVQSAATYKMNYNKAVDEAENAILAFLQYKEGVCRQFAATGTMLFRALGIPARYTTGYVGKTVAGEEVTITTQNAHAWVEIYIDGIGWIPVEVTGGGVGEGNGNNLPNEGSGGNFDNESVGGRLPDNDTPGDQAPSQKLSITPVYASKQYDGMPLFPLQEVKGFEKWEKAGFSYEVSISGSQTDYGYGVSKIDSFVIKDPDGKIVTDQFDFVLGTGKLHVYFSILSAKSKSVTKIYDDIPVGVSYIHPEGMLMSGHWIKVRSTASTDVGERYNTFAIEVFDESGKDVSDFYEFKRSYGTLRITQITISFKAGDASKPYDGTPLTFNGYTVASGTLLEGHQVTAFTVTGSQTEVGRAENLLTAVTIKNADGKDVTANYSIELLPGTLRVTQR